MRFPRTNFSNMAMGFQQEDQGDRERSEAEARKAAETAERRAYLEQKLAEAREAKRKAQLAAASQASSAKAASAPQLKPPLASAAARPQKPAAMAIFPVPVDANGSPIWQTAFSLAPNVRFTRTPESTLTKRRPSSPEEAEAEEAQQAADATEPTPAPTERPVEALQSMVETAVKSMQAAAEERPVSTRPLTFSQRAERTAMADAEAANIAWARAQGITVAPDASAASTSSSDVGTLPSVDARLANVSDFAFWDVMPFDGDLTTVAGPVFVPLANVIRSRPWIGPESIASLFRVVECRPVAMAASQQMIAARLPTPPAAPAVLQPIAVKQVEPKPLVIKAPPVVAPQPAPVAVTAAPLPIVIPEPPKATAVAKAVRPAVETKAARMIDLRPQASRLRDNAVSPAPVEWRQAMNGEVEYEFPSRELLQEPAERVGVVMTQETLEQNAGLLESVLEDFGVKGEIIHVRPGPVVTLYEFEPAPGVKSSRVIGLADDIARSMSALSARVAVVPGRNVIGIELPNVVRETVYFRELIEAQSFENTDFKLALCLGKNIGGEPIIAELAKMPHLLVAGTTGSGKSVAINTMILSLLYRLTPEQCRLIMVDPKMLELSVYDGIPHLLTPVVTDPKKAVLALKWAVREMEDRYRKMSRLGVRNIDGYNARTAIAREKGETIMAVVQTGFDKGTGAPIEESQEMDLTPMPYIVVIVDEMADLMMVAGKEIEGAIQRLAQMARAAGIHLIMATQRPSVDVITGTIKANFPTRISFQVTSKIDSRTILGEQGAEQLLGQGDMLHMAGGGRISRVHGPFVSDEEVEKVVAHLKTQGRPEYLDTVTSGEDDEEEEEDGGAVFDKGAMAAEDGDDHYEQAIKVVMRDKKCSTSYIQRRLGIGYNRAASLVERMEKDGLVGPANHVGKREIISGNRDASHQARHEDMD
ncbi:DNA translocase FtsK [Rhizobium tubonense]|uniref:DNA translocase FtsK n=1 Tax=Rhizobium tubonense TaxID=484088 RepID=A0A2W4CUU3_9HYPH|nr:DNA translocase FtsK [Rhizobium tubonense]PZM09194.1 DNA translocase FtsK [Rhizobium tubonense]